MTSFVRLTTPNGHPAYVNPEMVCVIEQDGANSTLTLIVHAGGSIRVSESPATVRAIIDGEIVPKP
jgi:archaellum component FlaG (FlaF/FlaG flagellin family)